MPAENKILDYTNPFGCSIAEQGFSLAAQLLRSTHVYGSLVSFFAFANSVAQVGNFGGF